MDQSPEQSSQPTPQERAAAQATETEALNGYLQGRVLGLNVEIQRRDARIAELEQRLAQADLEPENQS